MNHFPAGTFPAGIRSGERSARAILGLYLLGLLLVGLGYLAITPVFEGFDETAHYSSVRQIADTGTLPVYGGSFLDREVTDYAGPFPYRSGEPPFDDGMTYHKFFSETGRANAYIAHYRHESGRSSFRASRDGNWQAQHPPLYYALMAPLERALETSPLVTRLFVLRLGSYGLVLAGIILGLIAVQEAGPRSDAGPAVTGFMVYPVVLPMFFPEFARVGNDALCFFLVGVLSLLLARFLNDGKNRKIPLAMGFALGFGLLTKAFFLPIAAATGLFVLAGSRRGRALPGRNAWVTLVLLLGPAVLVGGGWYLYKLVSFGTLIGGADFIALDRQGGLVAGLMANFSLPAVIRGIVVTFVSYLWAGTWSLVRMPPAAIVPVLVLAAGCFGAFLWDLRKRPMNDGAWLVFWLFVMFGGGFLYHVLVGVAMNGNGQTPGWYLHILMPWTAPALGIGLCVLLRDGRTRWIARLLLLYAVFFQILALWCQFALFTGCAVKGDDKSYVFPGPALCLDRWDSLADRLSVIGFPSLAVLGFGGGAVCVLLLLRAWTRPRPAVAADGDAGIRSRR